MTTLHTAVCDGEGCSNRSTHTDADQGGPAPSLASHVVQPDGWLRIVIFTPPTGMTLGQMGDVIEKHFCQECAPHVRIVMKKEPSDG